MPDELQTIAAKLGLEKYRRHIFLCTDAAEPKCAPREETLRSWEFLKARLKELGLDERTLVLFTSDNGPPREGGAAAAFFDSTAGLQGGKGDLYEGGLRVPLLARWPKHIRANTVTNYPSAVWDFLPTLADLANAIRRPKPLDGVSLTPVLRGQPGKPRDMLYWEVRQPGFAQAVRMGAWKVVRRAGKSQVEELELYNLETDPGEKHNVATQHPEIVAKFIKPS